VRTSLLSALGAVFIAFTPAHVLAQTEPAPQPASAEPSKADIEKLVSEAVYRVNLGRADDVKLLIDQGVSPNSKDEKGVPLLNLAAARVDKEAINVIKTLLDAGADINGKDKESQSALFYAARKGNREIVTLLLENKINYYSVDYTGNIARTIAFREGHTDIVKLMDDFVKAETDKITEQYKALSKALEEQYKAQEDGQKKLADQAAAEALVDSRKTAELIEKQKLQDQQNWQAQKEAAEKEAEEKEGKWASQEFKQGQFNLAFNTCAFQYWSYCRDAGQTTELEPDALANAIISHETKILSERELLEKNFETGTKYTGNIISKAQKSIFNQLDAMPSKTYRFQKGVCRMKDMVERCDEIARYPGTQTTPDKPAPKGQTRRVYQRHPAR
jgi:hypothetical protein